MKHSSLARTVVQRHLKQGDLLPALAAFLNLNREKLVNDLQSGEEIADNLGDVRDILIYANECCEIWPRLGYRFQNNSTKLPSFFRGLLRRVTKN